MNCLSAPIYMGIDLTTKCNLRCIHCRVSTSSKLSKEIPLEHLKRILKTLSEMKVIQIIFSGGEPFIRPDIFEILSYAIEIGIPDVTVVSNGLLLNDEKINKLSEIGIKTVTISLDGLENAHDKIRGSGTFKKTIKIIKKLIKKGFDVKVTTTLTQFNKEDLIPLSHLLYKMGVKRLNVGNLMPCGRGKDLWSQSLNEKDKIKIYEKIKKITSTTRKGFILFESSFISKPRITISEKKIEPFLGCRGGRTYCAILANGDVVACKMLPEIVAGNIFKENFKKIWREDNRWKIWRSDSLNNKCKRCKYSLACRGGCKAISYHKYNSFNMPDPRCLGPFFN